MGTPDTQGTTQGTPSADPGSEEFWRKYLENPDSLQTVGRMLFSRLPDNPRCQLCASPFTGWGGRAMQMIGKRQSEANPNMCNTCERIIIKHHGGTEVEGSILFADIRGSTAMAERTTATEFRALLDRFYTVATNAVFANGGFLDKFVGDEVMAIYAPVLGANHAGRAIETARDLLRATGHTDPAGPWAPVGAAVHTGQVWFGALGEGAHVEVTVVGDPVNTAARLAAEAKAGEVLVSVDAARAAGLDAALPTRHLELKGKQETTEVVSLGASRS